MSAGNILYEQARARILNEVNVGDTYSVRTGRPTDSFILDSSVMCTSTAAVGNFTVTVPDGVAIGQRVAIVFEVEGSNETITVTTTTGPDFSLTAAADYVRLEWLGSVVGWVADTEVTT